MKRLLIALAVCALFTLGCAPSDHPPAPVEEAQTATATDGQITEMDFESGDVEQPTGEAEDTEAEPTPEAR